MGVASVPVIRLCVLSLLTWLLGTSEAFAQDELDSGDTAWILVSTALVLFMTMPGLALFYGGLVRRKNVLSLLMQCLILTSMLSVLWLGSRREFPNRGSGVRSLRKVGV